MSWDTQYLLQYTEEINDVKFWWIVKPSQKDIWKQRAAKLWNNKADWSNYWSPYTVYQNISNKLYKNTFLNRYLL